MNGKEPKLGDMIEILRGVYEHWGVYIGGGDVVHFVANSSRLLVFSGEMGIVKKNKLRDLVVAYPWRISNTMDDKYKPRPAEDIVKDACEQVGMSKPFSLIDYNCEHFANELRYGKKNSLQVQNVGQTVLGAGLEAVIWARTIIASAVQSRLLPV
ncbi:phospholipase A and acyltransferase 4-like [Xenentodon cancila]